MTSINLFAGFTTSFVSFITPGDFLTRCIVSVVSGLLTWCITTLITVLIKKFK